MMKWIQLGKLYVNLDKVSTMECGRRKYPTGREDDYLILRLETGETVEITGEKAMRVAGDVEELIEEQGGMVWYVPLDEEVITYAKA